MNWTYHIFRKIFLCGTLFVHGSVFAQQQCTDLLRSGVYDHFRERSTIAKSSSAKSSICSAYDQYRQDLANGKVNARYGAFSGGVSYSRDQIEVIGKSMCATTDDNQATNNLVEKASEIISEPAMKAWRQCIELAKVGMNVSTDPNDEMTLVSFTLSYASAPGFSPFKIRGVNITPSNAFACSGDLIDAKPDTLVDRAFQMSCIRRTSDSFTTDPLGRKIVASEAMISINTSIGTVSRHFPIIRAAEPEPKEPVASLGEIRASMLTEEMFQKIYGTSWVIADGRSVSGTQYAALVGPNVPDLRGLFLRGKNNGRTTDGNPDGEIDLGVRQPDSFKRHTHTISDPGHNHRVAGGFSTKGGNAGGGELSNGGLARDSHFSGNSNTGITINSDGGTETRPANVTVNFFIRVSK